MMLTWNIRYLDRPAGSMKDRSLYLRTETLEPTQRAAIELDTESSSRNDRRRILRYRHLFTERPPRAMPSGSGPIDEFRGIALSDYFEDETGAEITLQEVLRYLGPVDAPEPVPIPPIPVDTVQLSKEDVRILGYFLRDYQELLGSAICREGPGVFHTPGRWTPNGQDAHSFETSLTEDEIRSAVMVYRRLYLASEDGNVEKAAAVFVRALGDHPYARQVAGFTREFRERLDAFVTFRSLPHVTFTFSSKCLINVFLYNWFAHQPDRRRERQRRKFLKEVEENQDFLLGLFLTEIYDTSIHIANVGNWMSPWYERYCTHHEITPDVVDSLPRLGVAIGRLEKEHVRKARRLKEQAEKLGRREWEQAGCPAGGHEHYTALAYDRLRQHLGDEPTEGR